MRDPDLRKVLEQARSLLDAALAEEEAGGLDDARTLAAVAADTIRSTPGVRELKVQL